MAKIRSEVNRNSVGFTAQYQCVANTVSKYPNSVRRPGVDHSRRLQNGIERHGTEDHIERAPKRVCAGEQGNQKEQGDDEEEDAKHLPSIAATAPAASVP
jgi:hypothetical protein